MSLCKSSKLVVLPSSAASAATLLRDERPLTARRFKWRVCVEPICGHRHISSLHMTALRRASSAGVSGAVPLLREAARWKFSCKALSDGENKENDTSKETSSTTETEEDTDDAPATEPFPEEANVSAEETSFTTETKGDSDDAPATEPFPEEANVSAEISSTTETKEDSDHAPATEPFSEEANVSAETSEVEKVAVGSPLPGVNPSSPPARLPKEVVEVLRDQVFGFDTFFVTGQEPYEGGVLFNGNLRGDPSKSYGKLAKRLENKFGDKYKLFLLSNPTDDRPVSVVVPSESLEPLPGALPEWVAAGAFGAITVFTILLRNAPQLQLALLTNIGDGSLILDGLIGAVPTLLVLLAHEAGHRYIANEIGAKLAVPYFIPSWQLGSFGVITRITNILQNRDALLKLSVAGPLAGAAMGLVIVLLGLLLPPAEGQGLQVNASAFHESFLVGGLAKVILGDTLKEGAIISINPVVLSAWAGLLINSINSIPVGELDGGRISQALWGRKVWSRLTGLSIGLLAVCGIFSDIPLYWVVLVLFLQRGPITPQSEEISTPDGKSVALGVGILLLGLLIYFPFPFLFSEVAPPLVDLA